MVGLGVEAADQVQQYLFAKEQLTDDASNCFVAHDL